MTRTFRSPRTFHPYHSLLGRAFRRWTGDRLRGEAQFLFAVTALGLGLLIAHYLGWAFLQPAILNDPDGPVALRFWIGQVGSVLFVVGACLIGFRPALAVQADADDGVLHLEQGTDALSLSFDAIERADIIDARRYHRHYRRYAATRIFAGRLPDTVVLLRMPDGPVIVALASAEDNKDLLGVLRTVHAPMAESTPAHS